MRSEAEMRDLILETARNDARIRAVILNGSRANPHAPTDIFQDYDIVYVVTEIAPFVNDRSWPDRFGERIIMQRPDESNIFPAGDHPSYGLLMQFADGNRIDLTLFPMDKLHAMEVDSLSVLWLDKDGIIDPFPPSSESGYLPTPPTAQEFADCCNEFWWVSTYVAKGLWRREIVYAKAMQDQYVRPMLQQMLVWHIGIQTEFSRNPGKDGKYFQHYLEPGLWEMLMATYAGAEYGPTWDAQEAMGRLFRLIAEPVATHFGFTYAVEEDQKVSVHLQHVRSLPQDAPKIY